MKKYKRKNRSHPSNNFRFRKTTIAAALLFFLGTVSVIFWKKDLLPEGRGMADSKKEAPVFAETTENSPVFSEEILISFAEEFAEEIETSVAAAENESSDAAQKTEPPKVKGIYVTGPMAGSSGFQNLLQLVDETELNTMVIDVKNDEGNITYSMPLESAQSMGACVKYIGDMEGLMAQLKEHEVYTIARIVCFKDPYLAQGRPELALKKPDGTPVTDVNGLAWVNPYEEGVWEYLTAVAEKAAEAGFDEIQFDYVRFPIGKDAEQAVYGVDMETYPKKQAIIDFLSYASERLEDKNIPVTADVFGTIIGSETDVRQVGQDYTLLGGTVDALCPMVYPSHYGNHVFGLDVPDANPYETVLAALTDSKEELEAVPKEQRAIVRPWLQAFTATWVDGHISYGGGEIRKQIQAVYDAGYEEWMLWNAVNRYSADGLLPAESAEEPTAESAEEPAAESAAASDTVSDTVSSNQ